MNPIIPESEYITKDFLNKNTEIWINPIGGYGDILMISTALYHAYKEHGKKFNMVKRTQYSPLFKGHPAIHHIGFPPIGSIIIGTDYWSKLEFQETKYRAIEILFKIFGGTNSEHINNLYLPETEDKDSKVLLENIPWGTRSVAIAPSSESIRKMMHPIKWHLITDILRHNNYFVLQVGKANDMHIKGAYSLLGTTSPRQLLEVIRKVNFVITHDNFIMHAAQLVLTPAICLFGPTLASQYGYKNQFCLQANIEFCPHKNSCLGAKFPSNYTTPCPMNEQHCMNQFSEQQITDIIFSNKALTYGK